MRIWLSLHHRRGRTTASARRDSLRAPPWIWRTWPPGPISGPSGRGWAGVGVSSHIGVAIAGRVRGVGHHLSPARSAVAREAGALGSSAVRRLSWGST